MIGCLDVVRLVECPGLTRCVSHGLRAGCVNRQAGDGGTISVKAGEAGAGGK